MDKVGTIWSKAEPEKLREAMETYTNSYSNHQWDFMVAEAAR